MRRYFGFLIFSFIISSGFQALSQENNDVPPERAFVVVGYKALVDVPNIGTIPPDKRQQTQELVKAQLQSRITALHAAILDWRLKSSFSPNTISGNGEVNPAIQAKSATQLLFTMLPIVFEGSKPNLLQAIQLLDGQELQSGKFKVEELKENLYTLESDFGFWDNTIQDLQVAKVYSVAESLPLPTLEATLVRREEEYKNLIALYKESQAYKNKDVRHMVRFQYVHFGFINPSWRDEEYVGARMVVQEAAPLADGRIAVMIAVQEDVKEF